MKELKIFVQHKSQTGIIMIKKEVAIVFNKREVKTVQLHIKADRMFQ